MKGASNVGDFVCDPFMGSGTTAVVCKKLGRQFIGFDLSDEYVKFALERVAQAEVPEEEQPSAADGSDDDDA